MIQDLVPYAKLVKRFPAGDILDFSRIVSENVFLDPLKIYGLQTVTARYVMGAIEIDAVIVFHQNIIAEGTDKNSLIRKTLSFDGEWELEFGWGGGLNREQTFKITNMAMLKFNIIGDAKNKIFNVELKLIPKLNYSLGKIQLASCIQTVDHYTSAFSDDAIKKEVTLGNVIARVLNECKEIIATAKKNIGTGPLVVPRKEGPISIEHYNQVVNEFETQRMLANLNESDIPSPSEIYLVSFGANDTEAEGKAFDFHNKPMTHTQAFDEIANLVNNNITVFEFIENMLIDNGYATYLHQTKVGSTGKLTWMIIQSAFNNIGKYSEKEYRGITEGKIEVSPNDINRTSKSLISGQSGKIENIFNVHSRSNIIKSIQIETEEGEPTIIASKAADAAVGATGFIEGNNTSFPKDSRNNIVDVFEYLVGMSKKATLNILGLPIITINDNINLEFGGRLFSGLYKVIEVKHTIDSTFTTDVIVVQTLEGLPSEVNNFGATPIIEPAFALPEDFIDLLTKDNSFGSESDEALTKEEQISRARRKVF